MGKGGSPKAVVQGSGMVRLMGMENGPEERPAGRREEYGPR